MTARTRAAVLLTVAALACTAGCVQLPRPVTASSPARPAMQQKSVHAVMKSLDHGEDLAGDALSISGLKEVTAGQELAVDSASVKLSQRLGDKPTKGTSETGKLKINSFASTPGGSYPERVVLTKTQTWKSDSTHKIDILERQTAGSPWKISFEVIANLTKQTPATFGQDKLTKPSGSKAKVHGLTPAAAAKQLAAALQKPDSAAAKKFTKNKLFTETEATPDTDAKLKKHRTKSTVFNPSGIEYSYLTDDNNLVVLGTLSELITWRYKGSWRGAYSKSDEGYKLLPAPDYRELQSVDKIMYALVVRSDGTMQLAGADDYWVDLTGVESPPS